MSVVCARCGLEEQNHKPYDLARYYLWEATGEVCEGFVPK